MRTLILHIGTMKTGSSALQRFFKLNADEFASCGVSIPYFSSKYCFEPAQNALIFKSLASIRFQQPQYEEDEYYRSGISLLEQAYAKCDTVLLTSEILSVLGFLDDPMNGATSNVQFWESVRVICDTLRIDQLRVVVYFRRQDALIASLWKQLVKTGHVTLIFENFLLSPAIFYLDYEANLRTIESALGASCELVVRRYDRAHFSGDDICHDFCQAADIPWNPDFVLPASDENLSMSFDVAEAMRMVRGGMGREFYAHKDALISKTLELSSLYPDLPATTPFTSEQARAFMEPFQQGNSALAKRFFGEDSLFSDDYDQPHWVPNEQRIEQFCEELRAVIPMIQRIDMVKYIVEHSICKQR